MHAVDDVTLEIQPGETLGLVGETGCGKSTLARCMARLYDITSGSGVVRRPRHHRISTADELRAVRRDVQMIFQDPYGSLNPRRRVGAIIGDPFVIHGIGDPSRPQAQGAGADGAASGSTPSTTTASPPSSPAASASASAWPGPWPCARS